MGLNGTPGKITVGVTLQGFVDLQGSMGGSVDWSFNGLGGFMEHCVVAPHFQAAAFPSTA